MNEREREIEARVNAATGGEWAWTTYDSATWSLNVTETDEAIVFGYDDESLYIKPADAEFIAAAPADIRYLLARVRELEAENAAIRANEDSAVKAYEQRDKWIWKLEEKLNEYHTALTPFAEVGAAVAARPAYPPTQTIMRVGEASFTVAHLLAAADVLAVRAEAVTGGSVDGVGISEIMEDAK